MHSRLKPRLTFANAMSVIAVFIALATGGAYAANEWNGSNIQDGTLTGADIQDLSLGLPDYGANSISTGKLKDQDVRTADLRDLGVTNSKIAWDSVSSGKVIDNNLTGNDINEATLSVARASTAGFSGPLPQERSLTYDLPSRGTVILTIDCNLRTTTQPVEVQVGLGALGATFDYEDVPPATDRLITTQQSQTLGPGTGTVTGRMSESAGDDASCSHGTFTAAFYPHKLDGTAP
jgi:hypothetical protein